MNNLEVIYGVIEAMGGTVWDATGDKRDNTFFHRTRDYDQAKQWVSWDERLKLGALHAGDVFPLKESDN